MAKIGNLYLGGKESNNEMEAVYKCSIAFFLKAPSLYSVIGDVGGDWVVETEKGSQSIVARCKSSLDIEQIKTVGFKMCQEFLDVLSIKGNTNHSIDAPGERHIIIFEKDNKHILRYVSTTDFPIKVEATITQTDKNGNVVPEKPEPSIAWIPAFRYYRLSQSSADIYEAYRNLYLGLESLLNHKWPQGKNEGEGLWLTRALNEVNKISPLKDLVPKTKTGPVKYIIETQYKGIRCKLFHAKTMNLMPYNSMNLKTIADGYKTLVLLWRHIANVCLNIANNSGGVTYQGFKHMMDVSFANGFKYFATEEHSQLAKDATIEQLNELTKHEFAVNEYKSEVEPGQVLLIGTRDTDIEKIQVIHGIHSCMDNVLFSTAFITDGIYPTGVDKIENYEYLRLINRSSPKTIF